MAVGLPGLPRHYPSRCCLRMVDGSPSWTVRKSGAAELVSSEPASTMPNIRVTEIRQANPPGSPGPSQRLTVGTRVHIRHAAVTPDGLNHATTRLVGQQPPRILS